MPPYLGGTLVGILALSITLSSFTRTPFRLEFGPLFLWAWLRGPGLAMLLTSAVALLVRFRQGASSSCIRLFSAWFAGCGMVFMVWYALTPDPGFDSQRLLFAPLFWMGVMGWGAWLADRSVHYFGWMRVLWISLTLLLSTLLTGVSVLLVAGAFWVAWTLALLMAFSALTMIYLDSRGRFR
ncbi:MAG: hypothetical protein MI717_12350 [Spirochaetales bacterium]|nr:hypothetical protein [Spirochaetales bacterium]